MTEMEQRQALIFAANTEIGALAAKLRSDLPASEYRIAMDALRQAKARKADLFVPNSQSAFGA